MRLVAGLGNPDRRYRKTRHNIGRVVVDELPESGLESVDVTLLGSDWRPWSETYMNLLGPPLATFMRKNGIPPADLLVIHDELDLPLGQIQLRRGGGSAGHKGVESLIQALGSPDFWRLRLGISTPEQQRREIASEDFVLAPFVASEHEVVDRMLSEAKKAVSDWARDGAS